ncbi:VanW family protein [Cohnella boryungensis]|uniref:VanW family protein n=1 Tax=Cohnella boryungensis TaxID=768479 RepID=A0ABV8S729_9BACL
MKKIGLITMIILLMMVGAGVGSAMSYGSDEALPEEFSVGGLALGGLSPDAAIVKLNSRISELEATQVTLDSNGLNLSSESNASAGVAVLSLKELGLDIQAEEAIRAIERHRGYSWWERAKQRIQGMPSESYGINVAWDEAVLSRTANQAWGSLIQETGANATRTIDERDTVVYKPERMGRRIELEGAIREIRKLAPASLADTGGNQVHRVEAAVLEVPPEITVARLKEDGLERKLVEFTTSFATSGEGRSHNVTAAAKALNDTLLKPGEVFEYGKIVAKAEKEYGYKEAPVILKGKLTPGIGGGICQVSSTLYNAALLTGLEIVERRNHSLPVSYLPRGLDATFADGYVNFKFRNSTGKQLLIRTVVSDKTVTVKLFGTMPDNVSYRTETAELKVNPPKTQFVADPAVTPGQQKLVQKGASGYVVEAFLIKSVDGIVAERKKLSKDTYRTQDTLIAVHPDDPRLLPNGSGKIPQTDRSETPPSGEPSREIIEPI